MQAKFARSRGFTLLELVITVLIISVLAAFAYPSYDEYIKRGHRAEGMAQLHDIAARQERYYAQMHSYITASNDLNKLGLTVSSGKVISERNKYAVTVSKEDDDGGYTLTATQNFGDSKCGNLTLDALGKKDNSGTLDAGDCWK